MGDTLNSPIESKYKLLKDVRKSENFTVLFANVQSMNNKFQEIRDITHSVSPSVLCLQETWGKNSATDYSIRMYHQPHICTLPGAGIAIWVSTKLDFEIIKSPYKVKQIETATVKIPSKKLFILNVYRPFGFGNKHEFIKELGDYIDKLQADEPLYQFIITGDFNINLLDMEDISTSLIDTFTFRGFLQQVAIPTHITLSTGNFNT